MILVKSVARKLLLYQKCLLLLKIIVSLTLCYYIKIVVVLTVCIIILKLLLNQNYLLY